MPKESNTHLYFAAYAKLVIDDHSTTERVRLDKDTIYLAGIGRETFAEAEQDARACVNTFARSTRGTILPRVFPLDLSRPYEVNPLYDACCEAQDWFEKKVAEMNELEVTMVHTAACRAGKRKKPNYYKRVLPDWIAE